MRHAQHSPADPRVPGGLENVLEEHPTLTREDVLAGLAFSSRLLAHLFTVEKTA
ncbi:hypothetical protein DAETH_32840 (plasmid) [Deinococcus aetherius]|uniref:Uncharacterized protein n=1 Tax=Deinococcus aetherius TaxID=200252 RepID=A0ABM8AHN6_9DEIO|nr:hypothetical protein DAETH_32840 [Deinococcus aetherius]